MDAALKSAQVSPWKIAPDEGTGASVEVRVVFAP